MIVPNGMFGRRYFGRRYFGRAQEAAAIAGTVADRALLDALVQATPNAVDYLVAATVDGGIVTDELTGATITRKAGATGLCELTFAGDRYFPPGADVTVTTRIAFGGTTSADAVLFAGRVLEPATNDDQTETTLRCDDAVSPTAGALYRQQFLAGRFGGSALAIGSGGLIARRIREVGRDKITLVNVRWVNPLPRPTGATSWTTGRYFSLASTGAVGRSVTMTASSEADFWSKVREARGLLYWGDQRTAEIEILCNPFLGVGDRLSVTLADGADVEVVITGLVHRLTGGAPTTRIEATIARDVVAFSQGNQYLPDDGTSFQADARYRVLAFWAQFHPDRAIAEPAITVTIGGAGSGSFTIAPARDNTALVTHAGAAPALETLDTYGSQNAWLFCPGPDFPDLCSGAVFGQGANTIDYSVAPDHFAFFYLRKETA